MQRLVYSPKIQAYINTEDEGVIDISEFIVSGTITRLVNDVSTAELVIRNPGKRFTQPGNPTFLPMDQITIFGSRHKNRPVQMFTGYLDTTPYLQLYPGTCTIKASCTLKRLLYTYWDAGLPYTLEFLSKYGWKADLQTGTIRNPKADSDRSKNGKGSTDGSVGNLMFGILKEVGQWDEDSILIEEFPKDADDIVQGLVDNISGNVEEAQNQFEKFLSDIIGEYSGGVGQGSTGNSSSAQDLGETPRTVYCVGKSMNAPYRHLLAAMMVGLVECPCSLDPSIDECSDGGGFGNCQPEIGQKYGDGLSAGWRQEQFAYYDKPTDVVKSATNFFNECKQEDNGQDLGSLCQAVQGSAYPERYNQVKNQAEALLEKVKAQGCPTRPPQEPGPNQYGPGNHPGPR